MKWTPFYHISPPPPKPYHFDFFPYLFFGKTRPKVVWVQMCKTVFISCSAHHGLCTCSSESFVDVLSWWSIGTEQCSNIRTQAMRANTVNSCANNIGSLALDRVTKLRIKSVGRSSEEQHVNDGRPGKLLSQHRFDGWPMRLVCLWVKYLLECRQQGWGDPDLNPQQCPKQITSRNGVSQASH